MEERPIGAGKSSLGLIDQKLLFDEIGVGPGKTFLDLACGFGHYSLAVSPLVGPEGKVYAIDLWEEGIDNLRYDIAEREIGNIMTFLSDINEPLPVEDRSIDIALMATVLHDVVLQDGKAGVLGEVRRALRRGGRLAVIEFIKADGPPGPPIDVRLSPEETDGLVLPYGYSKEKELGIGESAYLSVYTAD